MSSRVTCLGKWPSRTYFFFGKNKRKRKSLFSGIFILKSEFFFIYVVKNIYTNLVFRIPSFRHNCGKYTYIYIKNSCVLHTVNTLTCFECFFFYIQKNIGSFENVFLHGFLKHNKKNIFLHFWILQHVCKTPKGISQYSKKYKNLILGGIHLLFIVNVWIKKSLKDEYPK